MRWACAIESNITTIRQAVNIPSMMQQTISPDDYPLVSKERSEKLDLLVHLIANSNQPILVLGPKGVGKTKLFEILLDRKKNAWHCFFITVDTRTTCEAILAETRPPTGMESGDVLQKHMAPLNPQEKSLLIIDNAGLLPPGEISRVLEHVYANSTLRAVLAMTPDELFIKNRTDDLVDDCYVIELSTLTKKQCGDFLRKLAIQSQFRLPPKHISDHMVESVYLESQGIPGNIMGILTQLAHTKKIDYAPWALIATTIVLVAIALAVQWLSGNSPLNGL